MVVFCRTAQKKKKKKNREHFGKIHQIFPGSTKWLSKGKNNKIDFIWRTGSVNLWKQKHFLDGLKRGRQATKKRLSAQLYRMPEMSEIPQERLQELNGEGSQGAAPQDWVPEQLSQLKGKASWRESVCVCVRRGPRAFCI